MLTLACKTIESLLATIPVIQKKINNSTIQQDRPSPVPTKRFNNSTGQAKSCPYKTIQQFNNFFVTFEQAISYVTTILSQTIFL
jgi:hypothetical protein